MLNPEFLEPLSQSPSPGPGPCSQASGSVTFLDIASSGLPVNLLVYHMCVHVNIAGEQRVPKKEENNAMNIHLYGS